VHAPLLNGFAYRVVVPMPGRWRREGCFGWLWSSDGDEVAAVVSEAQPVDEVGVAGDKEVATVMSVVMPGAQAHEVVGIGWSALAPVEDVMDFEVRPAGAARVSAASVGSQAVPRPITGCTPSNASNHVTPG
jgi:hypothetical protein